MRGKLKRGGPDNGCPPKLLRSSASLASAGGPAEVQTQQPSYGPETDPIEQAGLQLKECRFASRPFEDVAVLTEAGRKARGRFAGASGRIAKMTSRSWAAAASRSSSSMLASVFTGRCFGVGRRPRQALANLQLFALARNDTLVPIRQGWSMSNTLRPSGLLQLRQAAPIPSRQRLSAWQLFRCGQAEVHPCSGF